VSTLIATGGRFFGTYGMMEDATAQIFRSTDMGASWDCVFSSTDMVEFLHSVVDSDDSSVWCCVAEYTSTILRSTDDGRNWNSIEVDMGDIPFAGFTDIATDKKGTWCATAYYSGGAVYRSDDNGASWAPVDGTANLGISYIATDCQGVWVGVTFEPGVVFVSNDNGLTWDYAAELSLVYNSPSCIDTNKNGTWAICTYGGSYSFPEVYISHNNGASWNSVFAGANNETSWAIGMQGSTLLLGLTPQPPEYPWLPLEPSKVYCSTDGGDSWTQVSSLPQGDVRVPNVINSITYGNSAWYVGTYDDYSVYKSIDNGNSWTQVANWLITTEYGTSRGFAYSIHCSPGSTCPPPEIFVGSVSTV